MPEDVVNQPKDLLNHQQRKKVARKQRQQREREAGRRLDSLTGEAIQQALALAPQIETGPSNADLLIDVEVASLSEATFVKKRVNEALGVAEWLDAVSVWVWQFDTHMRPALSDHGRTNGFELRMERSPSASG